MARGFSEVRKLADAAHHIFTKAAYSGSKPWAEVLNKGRELNAIDPPRTWIITQLAEASSSGASHALREVLQAYDHAIILRPNARMELQKVVRDAIDEYIRTIGNAGWSSVGLNGLHERGVDELWSLLNEFRDLAIGRISDSLHADASHHFRGLIGARPQSWWDKHGWAAIIALSSAVGGAVIATLLPRLI